MAVTEAVVIFAFIFELVGALILMIISYFVLKRYLEFRSSSTLYLLLGILMLGISVFISSMGRLVALMEGITIAYHGFQYTPFVWIALALSLNVIADIFLVQFANHVFYDGGRKLTLIALVLGAVIFALVMMLIPTPELTGGIPSQSYVDLFTMIWMAQALFTFLTGALITYAAFKSAKKGETLVEKRGMQLLGLLGISLALTNIMFIIDELSTIEFGGNFSIFYYLGWIIAHTGIICAYLGFILPEWLKKRWE